MSFSTVEFDEVCMSFPAKPAQPGQPSLRLVSAVDAQSAASAATAVNGAMANGATASGATLSGASQGAPLTPEHLIQLRDAEKRAKKIRRAAGVASFGGWSAAIFSFLSAGLSLMPLDWVGLALAGALGFVAYHELKGRAELLRFQLGASKRLGMNQLFFAGMIVAYGVYKLLTVSTDPAALAQQASSGNPEAEAMMRDVLADSAGLVAQMTKIVYAGVIAIGVLVPGLTAIYYFSRARIVRDFVKQTPPWVVELMRARA